MKKTIVFIFAITALLGHSYAQKTVTITSIPTSLDEFVQIRKETATTPEGGAAMYILALKIYTENKDLGEKCLIVMTDRKLLRKDPNGVKGFSLLRTDMALIKSQMGKNKLIPNSYIQGSSPENGYVASLPYKFSFTSNPYSGNKAKGEFKVFAKCTGADSPRPITLRKNNKNLWKASNWSSILVGIKAAPVDDDL